MDWTIRIRAALASSAQPPDDDVIEELAQHARALYDAARAEGDTADEANGRVDRQIDLWRADVVALRRRARRPAAAQPPPARPARWTIGVWQDVRYAFRLLRRQPRFALLATLTMAMGIGATTLLFSAVYGVLMKPLPWPSGERMVVVKETRGGRAPRFNSFSNAAYLAWREQATTIDALAAWSVRGATLSDGDDPERIRLTTATASLFAVLGARPLLGSFFEDDVTPRVVLSERLWRRRFGGDPSVLGRIVRIDDEPYTVVGVLPDGLAYPDGRSLAWIPFKVPPATGNTLSMFNAVASLRPGATAAQAAAEGTARGRFAPDTGMTTMAIFGGSGPVEIAAQPLRAATTADVRRPLLIMLAAVGLLLITATANVASLQLARATTRRREMAIRVALGAGRGRVARQLLVESLLLGAGGGAAGLALAWLLHRAIPSVLPVDFPRVDGLAIDRPVVLFAIGVALVTSVALGLLPARVLDVAGALKEDGAASVGVAVRSRGGRLRLAIIAGQIAIACVLLAGASLLGRSFAALVTADRGYDPSGLLTATLPLPASAYSPERRYALVGEILDRVAAMPGVVDYGFTSELPLTPGGSTSAFTMRAPGDGRTVPVQASPRLVSARGLAALGMRVSVGRSFTAEDTAASLPVAIVNRAFARRYLGEAALGAQVPMGLGYQDVTSQATIVGVVDDVRYLTAADASQPEIYYAYQQLRGALRVPVVTLLVRTAGDPRALASGLRAVVRDVDGRLVPDTVLPLEDRMMVSLARPRLYAVLLGAFAVLALAVAGVGVFGVVSYTVAQRSRELAVRSALGARRADIVWLVLRQGVTVAVVGVLAGLAAALLLGQSIAALLYGVTAHDGLTFAVVPVVLIAMSMAACVGPALRAARLDPLRALRE